MEFEIEHELPCSAVQAWALLFSHEFEAWLDQNQSNIERDLRSTSESGGVETREVHVQLQDQLPPVIARVVGEGLGYLLREQMDAIALRMTWSVIPDKFADRIRSSGDYRLVDSPAGCRRIVRGKVEADLPLIGNKIEKLIASELQSSYDRGAELAISWIRERGS
jgi:hypothetical protein